MDLLRVSLEDPRPWRASVETLHLFLTEGVFYFTRDGVHLRTIDPSQVVLIDLFAPKKMFQSYELADDSIRVPMEFSEYYKVLSRISAEDRLEMRMEDVNLEVIIERRDGSLRREFYIPLMDVPDREADIDIPEGAMNVRVLARVLKDAVKDAGLFSSSAVLVARDNVFMVEAKSQGGVTRTVVRPGPALSIEGGTEAVSRYSLPFLQNIFKNADADSFVELSFGNDTPLRISYRIGDVRLTFYLAHMIL